MDFSDIRTTIHDVWNFCWPPVLAVVVLLAVLRFVHPPTSRLVPSFLGFLHERADTVTRLRELLEPYGLSRMVPAILLIVVIAVLFLVNQIALGAASKLPPYVSYQPDVLLASRMRDNDKLLLFRRYPTAEHLNAAYHMALKEFAAKPSECTHSGTPPYHRLHTFTKFAAICVLLGIVLGWRDHSFAALLRGLILLLLLAALWLITFVGLLYQTEQDFSREWARVRLSLQVDANVQLIDPVTDDEFQKLVEPVYGRWWRIYLFDPYQVSWIKRTLLTPPNRPPTDQ